jgi:glucoamylase
MRRSAPARRTTAAIALAAGATAAALLTAPGAGPVASAAAVGQEQTAEMAPRAAAQEPTPDFQPADKTGYATARGTRSKVWLTLRRGAVSDVYYPTADTPAVRGLQLVVTDGKTFTDTAMRDTVHRTRLVDERSLTFRQVDTDTSGDYRITSTYVPDPQRSAVDVRIRFESLTGDPYRLYVDFLPAIDNDAAHNTARRHGATLTAKGRRNASALLARPAFTGSTNEFPGSKSGLAQLERSHRLTRHRAAARDGVVEQTARTALTGLAGHRDLRLVLAFGRSAKHARATGWRALHASYASKLSAYQRGWHRYLASLRPPPADVLATAHDRTLYDVSLMVLAAGEDKTHRGGFVASPSMPWVWRDPATNAPLTTGPYHLVWSRDLYQIATALLLAGDKAAAMRAERFLFRVQQKPDGQFPQNSTTSGEPYWTGKQLDEWALPIVLAWQLGDISAATWRHVRRAAAAVVRRGPWSQQERWENQSGFSPATIAAEIAGLVCAADIARANDDTAAARRYLEVADRWQSNVKRWTATRNGPLAERPYFLRLAKRGKPNLPIKYGIGDSGPSSVDQRRVVDPSFLELVRLGVLPAGDRTVRTTIGVVDRRIKVTAHGLPYWHRFSFDGYGETASGRQWVIEGDNTLKTYGRLWPLLSGERGEYAIEAGKPAQQYLRAIGATATTDTYLLPEQVWDGRPPTGRDARHQIGRPTMSATPLLWTHAQYVRLAWDLHAGRILEQPAVVARRYAR